MSRRLSLLWISVITITLFLSGGTVILAQENSETANVVIDGTGLYAEANSEAEQMQTLAVDDLLTVLAVADDGEWVQVATADETVGWVIRDAVYLNGPYLPPVDGLTLTALNRLAGWDRFYRPYLDEIGDTAGAFDLQMVRAFMNDQFAYILLEGTGDVRAVDLVLLDIVTNNGGDYSTYQYAQPRGRTGTLFAITEEAGVAHNAADVTAYWGDESIVFRVPLALLEMPDSFNLVAVSLQSDSGGSLQVVDELRDVMAAVVTRETEPLLDSQIGEYNVNLRDAPRTGAVLHVLEPGTSVSLLGRSADGTWVLARLADGFAGWVAADYVKAAEDISVLPVVE